MLRVHDWGGESQTFCLVRRKREKGSRGEEVPHDINQEVCKMQLNWLEDHMMEVLGVAGGVVDFFFYKGEGGCWPCRVHKGHKPVGYCCLTGIHSQKPSILTVPINWRLSMISGDRTGWSAGPRSSCRSTLSRCDYCSWLPLVLRSNCAPFLNCF